MITKADSAKARKTAQQAGESTYQGKPCGKGHNGTRYTSNRACVTCTGNKRKESYTLETITRIAEGKPMRPYIKRGQTS